MSCEIEVLPRTFLPLESSSITTTEQFVFHDLFYFRAVFITCNFTTTDCFIDTPDIYVHTSKIQTENNRNRIGM